MLSFSTLWDARVRVRVPAFVREHAGAAVARGGKASDVYYQ